jgi:hypothetical protein
MPYDDNPHRIGIWHAKVDAVGKTIHQTATDAWLHLLITQRVGDDSIDGAM